MNTEPELINRVAESDLHTIALDDMIRDLPIEEFDLKDFLFRGLILKEKDFRDALKIHDWSLYRNKVLTVYCSADAIIPMWAYLLISAYATPFAQHIFYGNKEQAVEQLLLEKIRTTDWHSFAGKRVVIKGCSDKEIPASAYLSIAHQLQPLAQSIMYGEPCSTVPIFKRPRVL